MRQGNRNTASLLETIFSLMIFFSGALYVMKGPATNSAVFWYRTGLLVVGLIGFGVLRWRRWSLERSDSR